LIYRIEITAQAQQDADSAYAGMAENSSPAYAEKWYQELFTQIETLTSRPTRCPVAPESRKFTEVIRELIYGKRPTSTNIESFSLSAKTWWQSCTSTIVRGTNSNHEAHHHRKPIRGLPGG
jgi:plasmid stabilization system protein ParE